MTDKNSVPGFPDGDIDFYDLILVLKRRYRIILGLFLVAVLVSGAASFLLPPVYEVTATVSPGWIDVSEGGNIVRIDSAGNIAEKIRNSAYNMQVLESLGLNPQKYGGNIKFDVIHPQNSDIIRISHMTNDIELGKRVVAELLTLIVEPYSERLNARREEKDKDIEILKNKQLQIENEKELVLNDKKRIMQDIKSSKNKLALLGDTEEFLRKQIDDIGKNTQDIMKQREEMLKDNNADTVALLLYSNTIQQNLTYIDRLNSQLEKNRIEQDEEENKLAKFKLLLEDKDIELKNLNAEIEDVQNDIEIHELEKKRIEGIQIIQSPTASPAPVRPRKAFNIAAAAAGSLFFGSFLALFVDWWDRKRR